MHLNLRFCVFALIAYCLPGLHGCNPEDEASAREAKQRIALTEAAHEGETSTQKSGDDPVSPPRRLLVLRMAGDELEVLSSKELDPVSRQNLPHRRETRRPPAWNGRYNVTDCRGRILAKGAFRMPPSRVHALFDEVEGPAGPGNAPLDEVVLWMRVDAPRSACRVELWDRDKYLGRVDL